MKINDFIIKTKDVLTLIEILEDNRVKNFLVDIWKRNKIVNAVLIFLHIVNYVVLGILILNISINFFVVDNTRLLQIFLFLLIVEVTRSYVINRFLYWDLGVFRWEVITPIIEKTLKIYPKDKRTTVIDLQSTFYDYYLHLFTMRENGLPILINFIFLIVLSILTGKYKYIIVIALISSVILIIAGYQFSLSIVELNKNMRNNEPISLSTKVKRVWLPIFTNIPGSLIIPFTLIVFIYNHQLAIIPYISFLGTYVSYFWSTAKNLYTLIITRKNFYEVLSTITSLKDRYIFNNETFQLQRKFNTPTIKTLERSRKNNSLIIKNLIPMYPSNSYNPSHIYNFEFKPGIYQLHGKNGIGKTTLLKTLSLPINYQTEYSAGEIAINGIPLFETGQTLENFRDTVKYIGHISEVLHIHKNDIKYLKKYKLIYKLLNQIHKENHKQLSEGEQAVSAISQYYIDIKKGVTHKLLIIDEVFSRIYNGKDNPLRDETLELLAEITNLSKNLIILIVDHMTNINCAKHLKIDKKSITMYNPF